MLPLESSKLLCGLPTGAAKSLREIAREKSFAAGEVIFRERDPGDGLYVIGEGTVNISATVANGEARVLSRLGPGELFGEMAVLDNGPRSATATAEQPTKAWFIARADLITIMERTTSLSSSLVREVIRRLRDFNVQYVREVLEAERLALVGRFASSIVHDLRNPLNVIGISADLASLPTATAETRELSRQRIRKQVERISNMVTELLEFARGSQTSFVLAKVDYAGFVQELVEEIRPELAAKLVTIDFENLPPAIKVKINPPRLARVFQNLINNATDAMPSGGNIRLRFEVSGKDLITEMEDNGKGIAPEIADRLFEAFVSHGKANGTGLGLSIAKKIIQDHQGRIFARNVPEKGAVFGFALPIQSQIGG
jgi:signal transduction histidine kinase